MSCSQVLILYREPKPLISIDFSLPTLHCITIHAVPEGRQARLAGSTSFPLPDFNKEKVRLPEKRFPFPNLM